MTDDEWNKLTVNQKLDELRADIQKIAGFVNPVAGEVRDLKAEIATLRRRLSQVEAAKGSP